MDQKKLVEQLKASIERAKNWTQDGWKVTFGPHGVEVSSLSVAQELSRQFPYREEAVGYWKNVEMISIEVLNYLQAALAELENGNLKEAENKLYYAQYVERPLEKFSNTSKPVYESIKELSA